MSFAPLRIVLLASLALAHLPLAAQAEESKGVWSSLRASFELQAVTAEAEESAPMALPTLRSGHGVARSSYLPRLALWARGSGYARGRQELGYGMGAGASLPVLEHLSFAAGYRVTSFRAAAGDGAVGDARLGGAYLGFDFEF